MASCARLDGQLDPTLEFWDTIQGRAELRSGSAAGSDGNTPDVYLQLPFLAVAQVHRFFQSRSELVPMSDSSIHWKVLQFIGLPKEKFIKDFTGLRWICKSAVMQKWYLRALRPRLRHQLRPSYVHSYGFRKQVSTGDVTGLMRELLYLSRTWNIPLVTAVQDVKVAFDSMPHELIWESLVARGASALNAGLHMRELTALEAYITLPFVGETERFPFHKGGKQGGIETPDEWRALVEYILEPVIQSWSLKGFGFKMFEDESEQAYAVNHAVWADNIILFASGYKEMQHMINDLDAAFAAYRKRTGERYFEWKTSSLEYMVSGPLQDDERESIELLQEGVPISYILKETIAVLGDHLNNEGSTSASVDFNCSRADSHYFKHKGVLSNPTLPAIKRLRAWFQTTSTVALYNAATWHLTANILSALRTWELKKLRRVLRLRRRPLENAEHYNIRTSRIIEHWCAKYGVTLLYFRVLKAVYKEAFKDSTFTLDHAAAPLRFARSYRSSLWWETLGALVTSAKRRKLGFVHRQAGQQKPAWEHPFVCVWTCNWRLRLVSCRSLSQWMAGFADFSNSICDLWHLPRPGNFRAAESSIGALVTFKLPSTIEDIPALPANCKENSWDSYGRRIWIQTDNQGLALIMAGHAKLEIEEYRPLFVRTSRLVMQMIESGWSPRTDIADMVEWDGRELNTVADHAANMALDIGEEWVRRDTEAIREAKCSQANFRLCFDGARRGNAEASGGLAVFAYYPSGRRVLLLRAGKPFGPLGSAFLAEALALEWCLSVFRKL